VPSQQARNQRLFALTTAFTPIPASIFARRVDLQEDGTVDPAVGLIVKFPNDDFTAAFEYPADQQPVVLGDPIAHQNGYGELLGWPAQTGINVRAADIYVQVAALAGETSLRVTEYD